MRDRELHAQHVRRELRDLALRRLLLLLVRLRRVSVVVAVRVAVIHCARKVEVRERGRRPFVPTSRAEEDDGWLGSA